MSDRAQPITYRHVIRCVICGTRVESRLHETDNQFTVEREHEAIRRRQGWRLFQSTDSRRWYCPKDRPAAANHHMHEVNS